MGRSDLFEPDMRDIYRAQYGEVGENLIDALASEPLSIDQHRYINEALKVLKACMKPIEVGDSQPLIDYVDRFNDTHRSNDQASASLSVGASEVKPKVTSVASLFEQYEMENVQNWKPATLRENKASHAALIEIFDYLGLNADANTITRSGSGISSSSCLRTVSSASSMPRWLICCPVKIGSVAIKLRLIVWMLSPSIINISLRWRLYSSGLYVTT